MNKNKEFNLLADIAGLLKKYGLEAFERLASNLSSPEFIEQLVFILEASAKAGSLSKASKQTRKKRQSPPDVRTSLTTINDKEKAELLLTFYDGLMSKTIFPTIRSLKSFISDAGLPPLKATVREKAINQVIKNLTTLPVNELKRLLSRVRQNTFQDDRSLEGWSNIILNKNRTSGY